MKWACGGRGSSQFKMPREAQRVAPPPGPRLQQPEMQWGDTGLDSQMSVRTRTPSTRQAQQEPAGREGEDLQAELREMERMLRNLQRGITKDLLTEDVPLPPPEIKTDQRRSVSKSSWAKSGVKRELPGNRDVDQLRTSTSTDFDLISAEKNLKKRAAAYSIGKAPRDDLLTRPSIADAMYDPNIDAASTSKRARGIKFTTERRNLAPTERDDASSPVDTLAHSASPTRRQQAVAAATATAGGVTGETEPYAGDGFEIEEDDASVPKPSIARAVEKRSDRAVERQQPKYSFPKAPRGVASTISKAPADTEVMSKLDIDRANRYLTPNTATAVMRPLTYTAPPAPASSSDAMEVDGAGNDEGPETVDFEPHLDVLSTRMRTPGVSIRAPSNAARPDKAFIFGPTPPSPGPGTYSIETAKPGVASNPTNKGRIYHAESKKTYIAALRAAEKEAPGPGVGDYDVAEKPRVRGGVIMKVPNTEPTPHQLRKKYWEEKAQDLRLDHDDMREVNDSFIRPHTPSVTLAPQKETDWQRRMLLRKRLQERIEEQQGGDYSVNRSLIEPRAKAPPSMAAQVAAAAATRKRLLDKPSVLAVLAEKKAAEAARDKFYGPQLQVAWAAPEQNRDTEDSGEESPTEEINRMLARRSAVAANAGAEPDETTRAYLRSSLAAPIARASVIMRPPSETISRSALVHEPPPPTTFLGPQLPTDWLAEAETQKHKNRAIMMDLAQGRDHVQIKQKGLVQVEAFDSHKVKQTDALGPGKYDPAGPVIGEDVHGAVPFKQLVSRGDAIGPEGERPESALGDIAGVAGETLLQRARLDIEYGAAKDASKRTTKKGITINARERHAPAEEVSEGPEHLGGSWFEGLSEQIKKMPPVVHMGRMKGRSIAEHENEALMEEVTGVEAPGPLEIEVKDWKPMMPRPIPAPAFKDPKAFPRFEEPKQPEGQAGQEHLGGSYFAGMAEELKKKPGPVMSRMVGRGGDSEVLGAGGMGAELDGEVDIDAALSLAHARAAAIKKGEEATSKQSRPQFHADMSRQRGRDEPPSKAAAEEAERQAARPLEAPKAVPTFGKAVKGAIGFQQLGGGNKDDEAKGEALLRKEGYLAHDEQVDIAPDVTADSRFKKPASGASMGDPKSAPRFVKEAKPLSATLDYGDVDAGKLSGKAIGAKKSGGSNMGNSVGRDTASAAELKVLAELGLDGGNEEQLQITPDDTALKKPVKGGVMSSAGDTTKKKKAPTSRRNSDGGGDVESKLGETRGEGRASAVRFADLEPIKTSGIEPVSLPEPTPPRLSAPIMSAKEPDFGDRGGGVSASTEINNLMEQLKL